MRIGYLECFAGISGDMLMAALVDAGAPIELLGRTVASLSLGIELRLTRVNRSGIESAKVDVMAGGKVYEQAAPSGPADHIHSHDHDHDHHHHTHDHEPHDHKPHAHEHEHEHGRSLGDIRALLMKAELTDRARQ